MGRNHDQFKRSLRGILLSAAVVSIMACGTDTVREGDLHTPANEALQAAESSLSIHPFAGVQQAKLFASDGAPFDELGISVAFSGNTAIVGAHDSMGFDSGAAYVFVNVGGVWSQEAKLVPSDGAPNDQFGISVAFSGDTAIVGVYRDDDKGADSGSAYVFVRSGSVWTQQAKLLASDGAAGDSFGVTVALSGDTALLGANLDDHAAGTDAGSAYVFVRSGGSWTQEAKLIASDAAAVDNFGRNVALSGDTALVGAHLNDDNGTNSGSAYVFVRSGVVWTQEAKLLPADGALNDQFGYQVALSGDTALVGAWLDDDKGTDSGSAYMFMRNGGVWTQDAKLVANNGVTIDYFGYSVAISGNTALVGAYYDDTLGGADAGSVYLFMSSGGVWTEQSQLLATDGQTSDVFGASVALSGSTVLVGAWGDDDKALNAGSAYIFNLGWSAGTACIADAECASTFCVEGVCCDVWCGGGATGDCQACTVAAGAMVDGTCAPLAAGTLCREAVDVCDAVETCDGTAYTCPADAKLTTQCRAPAGFCDTAEACDGMTDGCPADVKKMAGTECRAPAGACDTAEVCDGMTDTCPADVKAMAGTECRMATGACDVAETCNGMTNACPFDFKAMSGTECRMATGACDVAETCDGITKACPADIKAMEGTECRMAAGACDVAETCDGMTDACPADVQAMAGTECRMTAGNCDVAETCDGMTDTCPADVKKIGSVCRETMYTCGFAETCDGIADDCPPDVDAPNGTACSEGTSEGTCQNGLCTPLATTSSSACGCRIPGAHTDEASWLLAALLGIASLRRRRGIVR